MAVTARSVEQIARNAREAALKLALFDESDKNRALIAIADALEANLEEVLEANQRDIDAGTTAGLDHGLMDRLMLDEDRVKAIAADVRKVAELDDPVGEQLDHFELENGLKVRKVAVPLGVVAVVYEARPNVTIDAASLCIKSGNAIILRGSSSAEHSNAVLTKIAIEAAEGAGLPDGSISLVAGGGREKLRELATQDAYVDLIIPRGGEGLKNALKEYATVPVLYAAAGNCHVYVDGEADLEMALKIIMNSKTQRPGVCNSAETLLINAQIAPELVPRVTDSLLSAGVELRTDAKTKALAGGNAGKLSPAIEDDWIEEFHGMTLAIKLVDSLDEAIDHINHYGTHHSDAIVTSSATSAERFTAGVDSACVYVNASTRFTDGAQFGMGAEIGNSTQKLHARGPIALRELCSFKYIVEGNGQVRS